MGLHAEMPVFSLLARSAQSGSSTDGTRQFSAESDADPAVLVIVSNGLCSRMLGIEYEPVGDRDSGYIADQDEHTLGAILEALGGQVYVTRRSPRVQRGKQDSALQYESVRMRRTRQEIEKAFEGVELDQLVRWSPGLLRLALEIQVPSAGLGLLGRSNHSTTSRAWRTALSAPRKDRAISISAAGLEPCARSQRRSASHAISAPSRWRSRTISTSERSAE